jgi:hypothetical protein
MRRSRWRRTFDIEAFKLDHLKPVSQDCSSRAQKTSSSSPSPTPTGTRKNKTFFFAGNVPRLRELRILAGIGVNTALFNVVDQAATGPASRRADLAPGQHQSTGGGGGDHEIENGRGSGCMLELESPGPGEYGSSGGSSCAPW